MQVPDTRELLQIAGRIQAVPQISLYRQPQGVSTGNVESADVCGPLSANRLPAMMRPQLVGETPPEAVRLADVHGVPEAVGSQSAEDVHARYRAVHGTNLIELKLVPFTRAVPIDRRE